MTTPITITKESLYLAALNGIRSQDYQVSYGKFPSITCPSEEDDTTGCLYRGPGSVKCAFGHAIPDELYDPSMENKPASAVLEGLTATGKAKTVGDPGDLLDLATKLQTAHDYVLRKTGVTEWENLMQRIAATYGLSRLYTEPTPPTAPSTPA